MLADALHRVGLACPLAPSIDKRHDIAQLTAGLAPTLPATRDSTHKIIFPWFSKAYYYTNVCTWDFERIVCLIVFSMTACVAACVAQQRLSAQQAGTRRTIRKFCTRTSVQHVPDRVQ